jgi:L-ascorbate metabolism protein UlaG (beta-lactamase superfamily)
MRYNLWRIQSLVVNQKNGAPQLRKCSGKGGMKSFLKNRFGRLTLPLLLLTFLSLGACGAKQVPPGESVQPVSDNFDGQRYFNPGSLSKEGEGPKRGVFGWIWQWLAGNDWPEWPEYIDLPPGSPPAVRVPKGTLRITAVGHSTFLIQMDGLNILTDPVWSERCSPVSWAGPRRRSQPGIRFEDLPSIDAVLVSHNHYDHLDQSTLARLAKNGTPRSLVPLGNRDLVREAGIPAVDELDWWQSTPLSSEVKVTLVPAQHFSSRSLWDRNRALWGGFLISGPSGNIYFSGDSGYGPHFLEIARRFSPIRVAILPISPYQPQSSDKPSADYRLRVHMRPREAVQAHLDLGAPVSVAAHFQVFQLGPDGFDDAVQELAATLKKGDLNPDAFIALKLGQSQEWVTASTEIGSAVNSQTTEMGAAK